LLYSIFAAMRRPHRLGNAALAIAALSALPETAHAHVRWFAPYIIDAPPQSVVLTLKDPAFWIAIALVIVFFVMTRAIEVSRFGAASRFPFCRGRPEPCMKPFNLESRATFSGVGKNIICLRTVEAMIQGRTLVA
jgi:hypothetical protein